MAKGRHLYEEHYNKNKKKFLFTRWNSSHLTSSGNLSNAESLGCKPSLAKLVQKIELPDFIGVKFGMMVYGISPGSGNIWYVRACLFNSVKNVGDCGWIPSFETLEDACKGAAQILANPDLLQQLLWQCSGHRNVAVPQPARMQDFCMCVDNCDVVQWNAQKKVFMHPDDGAKSDEDFDPEEESSSDSDEVPLPNFEDSSSSSSSDDDEPVPVKRKRKRVRKSMQTGSPRLKRSKPLSEEFKTVYIETGFHGVVGVDYNRSKFTIRLDNDYDESMATLGFQTFAPAKALDQSETFVRALQVCESFDDCELKWLHSDAGIGIESGGKTITISN